VESLQSTLRQQYSNSSLTKLNNSNSTVNSTVTCREVFSNLSDVIPNDDYMPFYVSQYKRLGVKRFVELANKARKGREPKRLFFWLLKNNDIVM